MLFGADIHIYTDHRNLTFTNLTSQRVLWWCLFLEEFTPTFHYIKGSDNVIADALSQLPIQDPSTAPSLVRKSDVLLQRSLPSSYSITMDDHPLLECFLYHPEPTDIVFPLDYTLLRQQQFDNKHILITQQNIQFMILVMCNLFVIHQILQSSNGKLQYQHKHLTTLFDGTSHLVLNHVSMTFLHLTISTQFHLHIYAVLLIE